MNRLEPHSPDVEKAVLGAVLLDGKGTFEDVASRLTDAVFYTTAHRKIFKAIASVCEEGGEIDVVTVTDALNRAGDIDDVPGGAGYVAECAGEVVSAKNVDYHCGLLLEDYGKRILIHKMERGLDMVFHNGATMDETMTYLSDMDDMPGSTASETFESVVGAVVDEVQAVYRDSSLAYGVRTGIPYLDRTLLGWQPEFIIIAARPSTGKTALALHSARKAGVPVYFASREMSKKMVTLRLLSGETGINSFDLRTGGLSGEEFIKVEEAEKALKGGQIFIDDRSKSPEMVCFNATRMKKDEGIQAVFVDYIQLLDPPLSAKGSNREREVAGISSMLKDLSIDLDVPVVALAQLNRESERLSRRPRLSDLRDSGSLEQDADVVIFLHPVEKTDVIEIVIAKNRNGPTGFSRVRFRKNTGCFEELE